MHEESTVAASQLPFEFLMNALRLADGFPPALFEARTAQPLATILPALQAAAADQLLTVGPERIAPTLKGRRFLNVLLERFLSTSQPPCTGGAARGRQIAAGANGSSGVSLAGD